MTDETKNINLAAKIALEILERAESGQPLFSLHKHYPTGLRAMIDGWHVGFGFCSGAFTTVVIGYGIASMFGIVS